MPIKTDHHTIDHEGWDFSLWLAILSPLIGIFMGPARAVCSSAMNKSKEETMKYHNVKQKALTHKRRHYFQNRRRQHDPMLVLNMSIFNFEGGWSRIFNPIKARETN